MAITGFGPGISTTADLVLTGGSVNLDVQTATNDVIIESTIGGASTVTLQLTDPKRKILRSQVLKQGMKLAVATLTFVMVQTAKAGTQLQIQFEDQGVSQLRLEKGVIATTATTNISGFAEMLVHAVPGLEIIAAPLGATSVTGQPIQVGRGSTSTVTEDSWTALQRIATTAGWRCWSYRNVIYFGPDTYWLEQPSIGTLKEFTVIQGIENIDGDWDVGKPYGNLTVTAMCNLWTYPPGAIVTVVTMGVFDGKWMVYDCQRDFYNPQAAITLTVPMPPYTLLKSTSESTGGT